MAMHEQLGHVSGVVKKKVRTHSVNVSCLLALRVVGGWGSGHKLTQTL